ncbi:Sec-independent protein translocase protein TatB [Mycolicibacterium palauense]|uniref:Sec-independent protein translocase protein TatB n=1 Tax=Mycolicibacterium palauense TaxID=2034511 RepID=UPI000BFF0A00|nr:Sec-independent protein translocase protein TatB [Mycolicibacterium palauense]
MFANVGWGEMLVLVIIGLVVLGPERLPGAIRWTAGSLRQARDYVTGATSQLREEFGSDFEDLREPLSELQKLRGMNPRTAITKHLLDGDDSIFTGKFEKPVSAPNPVQAGTDAAVEPQDTVVAPPTAQRAPSEPATPGPTKFDTDAT